VARPRQVSDDEILEAVRRAVIELGPHVSMDHVAERLGVTAPALFRRFGNREDLMLAALRPGDPPYLRHLEAGPDDRPIFDQLVDLFVRIGSWVSTTMPCVMALRESGFTTEQLGWHDNPPPLLTADALSRWLEKAQRRGLLQFEDAGTAAVAILGAIQAPIFLRHLHKQTFERWELEGVAHAFVRLFLRGVAPDPVTAASNRRPKERS
jgi:AcrR family transcriptional regulator